MADIKIIVDSSDVATATNRVDQLGSSGTVAQKGIDKASRGMNQFGTVAKNGGKKLNTFNMQIQQGGYQLQDFVVQLQSGTSFFTAFGQQGSQFAGVFGPQGAVIGAIIAIGSAVGGMGYKMLTASEDVKTLQEKVEDLETTTSDYADALSGLTMPVDAFGNVIDQVAGKVSALSQAMLEVKKIKFEESLKAVTNLLPAFESSPLGRGMTGMEAKNIFDLFPEIKQTQSAGPAAVTAADFGTLIGKAMEAEGIEEQAAAFEAIRQSVVELAGPFETMNEKQRQFYESVIAAQNQIQQVIEANEAANAKIEDEKQRKLDKLNKGRFSAIMAAYAAGKKKDEQDRKAAERQANEAKRVADAQEKVDQAAQDKLRLQNQSLALLQIEAGYGKDSEQYARAVASHERENLAIEMERAGVNQSIINSLLDGNMRLEDGRKKIKEQKEEAIRLKKVYDEVFKTASFLFKQRFQGEATVMDQSLTPSGKIGMSYEELLAAGVPHENIIAMGIKPPKKPKTPKTKESDLEKLRSQLDLEDALLGKTEARQRVIQALGVKFVEDNPKTVAGLEAQITANENLLRIEEERKRMNDLVTNSMEKGLMAMADGTKSVKDAFRDMAREIIAELYRILVVQQMVNAAKSFFGFPFADGGAFSGGSQIQAYADGGVVGSPTLFPMAGGKTGLMGEAGPEAIMPLKRGANGKLGVQMEGGGGDNVVINQSFNFQANGDDSVKKIIAQAAPQIAQMTKNSMLNDRRRGGTTKAVFG